MANFKSKSRAKMIILIIVAIIAIPFVAALFASDEYVVDREVLINKPDSTVFNYIKLLRNQEHYNKWVMQDPNAIMEYKGEDGKVGFTSSWDSQDKSVGKGEQEIKSIEEGKLVTTEIRFEKPMKNVAYASISTKPVSNTQTTVKWSFSGHRNYIMKVIHIVFNLKKMLGKDIDTSLNTLKTVLEK